MKQVKQIKKLSSQAGETIFETLVSLMIAALALFMLAGAITSASGVIQRSKTQLDAYYSANETGVVGMSSGGTAVTDGVTITDADTGSVIAEKSITYYTNETFSQYPVIAYKLGG